MIVIAYWFGLGGPFIFDDIPNIVENKVFIEEKGVLEAAFSTKTGPLHRPVSMASLWLNHAIGGVDPWGYKLANLFIHILATLGVIAFVEQILRGMANRYTRMAWLDSSTQMHIAILSGLLWGLHPINLSSVLYVVQRMTSLSGMFALFGLALYCRGRNRIINGQAGWNSVLIACLLMFPLSVLSKENNLVWPIWIASVEWLVFGFAAPILWQRKLLKYATVATFVALLLVVLWVCVDNEWLQGWYKYRDFTLTERLLTQARVLWYYLYWILLPQLSSYGLYHDDIFVSTSLVNPWTTIVAITAWAFAASAIFFVRRRYPWITLFAIFFLVGHLLESTIVPLEMVHEHRNYIPSLSLMVIVAAIVVRLRQHEKFKTKAVLFCFLIVGVLFCITAIRAYQWASLPRLTWAHVQAHPNSPRSNYEAGVWYYDAYLNEKNKIKKAEYITYAQKYFERVSQVDTKEIGGLVGLLWIDSARGLGVMHVNNNYQELVNRLATGAVGEAKGGQLIGWYMCYKRGECKVELNLMRGILHSVLDNPGALSKVKGRLAHLFGLYLLEQKQKGAASYFELAISLEPSEGEYWIALIHTLINDGDSKKALQVYEKFASEQRDVFVAFNGKLESYRKSLRR